LHELPAVATVDGEINLELYLAESGPNCRVSLSRMGTRVPADLLELDEFQHDPWGSGCLQGIIDAPFLNLTPGTRAAALSGTARSSACAWRSSTSRPYCCESLLSSAVQRMNAPAAKC